MTMTADDEVRAAWMNRKGITDPTMWDGLLPAEREHLRAAHRTAVLSDDPFAQPTEGRPESPDELIRNGRYYLPKPENPSRMGYYTRSTNFAKHISDTYRLSLWQQRMAVAGACQDDGLRALASGLDVTDDRAEFDKVVEAMKVRADKKGRASLGSAVHKFTERIDAGTMTLDKVPTTWRADCAAYVAEMDRLGLVIHRDETPFGARQMSEVTVYEPTYGIVGTLDRIVRVTRELEIKYRDGRITRLLPGDLVIFDLKTGARALEFGGHEHAIQFATYANATHMFDKATRTWHPMPEGIRTDIGLVFHLPIGKPEDATVAGVDISAGWDAAYLVRQVKDWQNRKDLLLPLDLMGE